MTTKKKFFSLLFASALALGSFTSCQNSGGQDSEANQEQSKEKQDAAESTADEKEESSDHPNGESDHSTGGGGSEHPN